MVAKPRTRPFGDNLPVVVLVPQRVHDALEQDILVLQVVIMVFIQTRRILDFAGRVEAFEEVYLCFFDIVVILPPMADPAKEIA